MDDLERRLIEGSIERSKYDEIKASQATRTATAEEQADSPQPAKGSAADDQ